MSKPVAENMTCPKPRYRSRYITRALYSVTTCVLLRAPKGPVISKSCEVRSKWGIVQVRVPGLLNGVSGGASSGKGGLGKRLTAEPGVLSELTIQTSLPVGPRRKTSVVTKEPQRRLSSDVGCFS
jgi:hypothetical protein